MKRFVPELFRRLPPVRPQTQWHFLLLFPWFIPLLTYWVIGPRYWSDAWTFASATLLNLTIGGCCLITLDQLTQLVVSRYPNLGQTWQRVWRLLLVFMTVTPFFVFSGIYLYSHFHLFGYNYEESPFSLGRIILINGVANLLSVGIDESTYSLKKWRENMLEKEQLRKINIQSQLESLKNQVNPHFLFNSLNSLSSLIDDDAEKAGKFLDEMAKVYRYLLQTNEGSLTTLDTELTFIQSYYHLLKTRYGAGIHLDVVVPPSCRTYQLPPLTLQMLVENAIKHNVIHAGKPLLIEIETINYGQLLVRNNRQPKTGGRVMSNQVGLSNIAAKYRLLVQEEPTVLSDDTHFTVIIPLMNPVNE
ncbi:sensor histidine kinase [Spirosoma endophyticum]|uniref:Histidine kinase n=1 Tax=Spirosoma endophyticum TaxID=662367 RepID=A0A1I1MZ55_9BACT|nr:histidine kinase [Spirosoma endophyticum]SFC90172.1 Histidine kinase [Spirosoma endophyticum]